MARVSKTICDRCGHEHTDGTPDVLYIRRLVISVGTRAEEKDYIHQGRDLCMECRDAVVADINRALDFTTKPKEIPSAN